MAIDQTTESIAHFIGLFALAIEKMVLREQYDEFRAAQKAADELEAIEADPFKINSGYRLKDYDPDLNYRPPSSALPATDEATAAALVLPDVDVSNSPLVSPVVTAVADGAASNAATIVFNYTLPIPSSIVAVTVQLANLSDNDSFGQGTAEMFVAPVAFSLVLSVLTDISDAISGFQIPQLPETEDGVQDFALAALEQVQQAITTEPELVEGATVAVISGDATFGITINGEAAEEVPTFDDLLPEFLKPEETTDSEDVATASSGLNGAASNSDGVDSELANTVEDPSQEVAEAEPLEHDFSKDFDESPNDQWKVDEGHEIVAGANTQVNEVQVASSWLDATVIAVKGDVIKIDAISQVNVFAGQDVVNGVVSEATSTALNVVEIIQISSEEPAVEALDDDDEFGTTQDLTTHETASSQATFQTSTTVVHAPEEELTEPVEDASPVYEGLPTDAVVVRVEGDVTQINWTVQDSFITDNDSANVTISASATYLGLGDNTVANQALLTESGFNYDLILVGGDLIDLTMITQTNVMLDGGRLDTDFVEEQVDVSSGENLQYNSVALNTVGIDTEAELEDSFVQTLDALEDGAEDVGSEVQSSDHFDGVELLRVLYIEGDYISINVADQTNTLSDVDQVNVAQAAVDAAESLEGLAEDISADTQAEISVIMGSNAQGNIASIQEFGTDSIIMAGGDYYSEALIHQADLIDTDAIPTGVEVAALANEAVAFLADDLLDANAMSADIISGAHSTIIETAGQSDVMQTVLS